MTRNDVSNIQAAKKALLEEFGERPWFRGAGIAPGARGLQLRLNVDPEAELGDDEIPKRYRGFAVEVVRIRSYRPRRTSARR